MKITNMKKENKSKQKIAWSKTKRSGNDITNFIWKKCISITIPYNQTNINLNFNYKNGNKLEGEIMSFNGFKRTHHLQNWK